jgi:hypothetical protein
MKQSKNIIKGNISLLILITFFLNISCTKTVQVPIEEFDKDGWSEEGDYRVQLKSGQVERANKYMIESDALLIQNQGVTKKIALNDVVSIEQREVSGVKTTLLVGGITLGVGLVVGVVCLSYMLFSGTW